MKLHLDEGVASLPLLDEGVASLPRLDIQNVINKVHEIGSFIRIN
jgi:hypothetical protein